MLNGKPLICVSADLSPVAGDSGVSQTSQKNTYPDAVYHAGGIPMMPCGLCASEMAQLCDGLLLTGGVDVDPKRYGETLLNDTVSVSLQRDTFEFALFDAFLKAGKPIFGICRGCQLINVAMGGTLYQDLAQQKGLGTMHRDSETRHPVTAEPGSLLEKLFGPRFCTNSTHHQSVKTAAPGLWITARSEDGIAEAFEHTELPILATQFHPERLTGVLRDNRTPDFQPLFEHFVRLCKK